MALDIAKSVFQIVFKFGMCMLHLILNPTISQITCPVKAVLFNILLKRFFDDSRRKKG